MQRLTIDEFKHSEKLPLTVVLDDVRSLHNVGAVFRTCGITATPPNAEIHKTALGGEDSVDWTYYPTAVEAVKRLHGEGYVIASVEQAEGSTMLDRLTLDTSRRYAVVLGNEVKGVNQEVVDLSDMCIEIPQFGTKHSLNVSVAGGIIVWEFAKRLMSTSIARDE